MIIPNKRPYYKVFTSSFVPSALSFFINISAITIGPFIFVRGSKISDRLLRHELVHVVQYRELYYVGFVFLYVFYWLLGLWRYMDPRLAYKEIPFEQEARHGESHNDYVILRPKHAWTRFKMLK